MSTIERPMSASSPVRQSATAQRVGPPGARPDVRQRLVLSELAVLALIVISVSPNVVLGGDFSTGETLHYLGVGLLILGLEIAATFQLGDWLTRPLTRDFAAEASPPLDADPAGAPPRRLTEARARTLNLPVLWTGIALGRYLLGFLLISLWLSLVAGLASGRAVELFVRSSLVIVLGHVLLFFVSEWVLQSTRRYLALRGDDAQVGASPRVLQLNVYVRLLLVVLLIIILPISFISFTVYDTASAAPAQSLKLQVLILTTLVTTTVVASLVAVLLARSIAHPLRQTTAVMARVGRGDLGSRVAVLTNDELGRLAESFNQMIDQLQASQRELHTAHANILELNRNLELKVAERTAEFTRVANRNRVILESIGDGLIVFDGRQRAVLTNPAIADLFGLPPNSVIGHHVSEVLGHDMPSEDNQRWLGVLTTLLAQQNADDGGSTSPVLVKFKIGPKTLATSFSPIGEQGGDLAGGLVAIFRDITTEETISAELARTNSDLAEANRHKSQFLANMSHELRTPLNSIIGFSDLLGEETFGPLNARQARYVSNINWSGKHLLQLINDLLDLSKIEAGRLELDIQEFGVAQAIDEVQAMMRALIDQKRLTLSIELAPDVTSISADPGKFRQVLVNLLSNAIKFTDEGGQVGLLVAQSDEWVRVAVRDTGIGISRENLRNLFKEFRQLDASTARRYEGTGLGLALCKKLIELHGGRIEVVSEPGMGSTFTICLPRRVRVLARRNGHGLGR